MTESPDTGLRRLRRRAAKRELHPDGIALKPQVMAMNRADPKAPDEIDRALGNAIYLRRRSLGMSQDQLAHACGISFQQVQKYENGANRVSFSRLVQIARALDCRVADLASILDEPQLPAENLEALRMLTLPGASDLLRHYEKLSTESRRLLVGFLGSV